MDNRKFIIGLFLFVGIMALAVWAIGKAGVSGRTKFIALIILAIVIFIILRKTDVAGKISSWFNPRDIDYDCATEGTNKISETREKYLEGKAKELFNDIESTPVLGHKCELYTQADALCDTELIYLAQYYKRYLSSGDSLHKAINTQFDWWCESDMVNLMAHLSKVGES